MFLELRLILCLCLCCCWSIPLTGTAASEWVVVAVSFWSMYIWWWRLSTTLHYYYSSSSSSSNIHYFFHWALLFLGGGRGRGGCASKQEPEIARINIFSIDFHPLSRPSSSFFVFACWKQRRRRRFFQFFFSSSSPPFFSYFKLRSREYVLLHSNGRFTFVSIHFV